MKRLEIPHDTLPLAELDARGSEVVWQVRARGRPLVITEDGKPAAVLLTREDFERLTSQERFRAAVDEGLAAVEAGRVHSHEDVVRELGARVRRRGA